MYRLEMGQAAHTAMDQDELLQQQQATPTAKSWGRVSAAGLVLAGVLGVVAFHGVPPLTGQALAAPAAQWAPPAAVTKLLQLDEAPATEAVSLPCKQAYAEHVGKVQQRVRALMVEAIVVCAKDPKGAECKGMEAKADRLNDEIKSECEAEGELCKIYVTAKDGMHVGDRCIPKACHGDDADKLEAGIEAKFEKDEGGLAACKGFDCTVDISCS